LLLDRELEKVGLDGTHIEGYQQEFRSHLDVAMEVLSGRVDAASAIRPVGSRFCSPSLGEIRSSCFKGAFL